MDQVTHLISGLLQSNLFKKEGQERVYFKVCTVCALIPDIDLVARIWGREAYLIHHRGLSHSIFLSVFWALLTTLVLKPKGANLRDLRPVIWAGTLCVIGHLFLDLFTSYGTSLLAPFTYKRFALDALFIIDPVYTLTLIFAFVTSIIFKKKQKLITRLAIVFWLCYPILCLGTGQWIQKREELLSKTQTEDTIKNHVLPEFLTPFYWKLLKEDNTQVRLYSYSLITRSKTLILENKKVPLALKEFQGGEFLDFFFNRFLRFPFTKPYGSGGSSGFIVIDLRFFSTSPVVFKISWDYIPFALVIESAEDRSLKKYGFTRVSRASILQK